MRGAVATNTATVSRRPPQQQQQKQDLPPRLDRRRSAGTAVTSHGPQMTSHGARKSQHHWRRTADDSHRDERDVVANNLSVSDTDLGNARKQPIKQQ